MSLVRGLSRWLKLFGRLGARAEACAWENLAAVALANKTAGQHALGMGKSRRDSEVVGISSPAQIKRPPTLYLYGAAPLYIVR